MPKYRIFAGLGGGFGGVQQCEIAECTSLKEATDLAYREACDQFDSQEGCGMDGWNEFMDEAIQYVSEEDFEDDESAYESALEDYARQLENDARESWIEYYAEEVTDEELLAEPVKEIGF